MTSTNRGTFERRPDDEQAVDQLLAEAGFPADPGLRRVLLQLKAMRDTEVPEPSAALRALMGMPDTADIISVADGNSQHAGRARKKSRVVLTSLAVAASLGVAGGAAAGNETIRRGAEGTISTIIRSFAPPVPDAPAPPAPTTSVPAPGDEAPGSGAAVVPVPGGGNPPPAPAPQTAGQRSSDPGQIPADGQREAARQPGGSAEVQEPGPGASGRPGPEGLQEDKSPSPFPTAAQPLTGQPAPGSQEQPGAGRPVTKGRPDSGVPDGPPSPKSKVLSGG